MNIAIVGLGLIGGSFAKALQTHTSHRVLGLDTDSDTVKKALRSGAIDRYITINQLQEADLTIVALYPEPTVRFIRQNAARFKKNSIVMDICGVKEYVINNAAGVLKENGIRFVPTHPMAGREFSGFDYSLDSLYKGASMIITPTEDTDAEALYQVSNLSMSLLFKKVVTATPKDHDRIIAFTSQLAHVVSNAFIKSPTSQMESGFSAGSFLDLTRVAKLNEDMWSSLFMLNKEALLDELDTVIRSLEEYRTALVNDDQETMRQLLQDGRLLKEESLKRHKRMSE